MMAKKALVLHVEHEDVQPLMKDIQRAVLSEEISNSPALADFLFNVYAKLREK